MEAEVYNLKADSLATLNVNKDVKSICKWRIIIFLHPGEA